jgi:RNA polymerase sigma factor (sigma-70 family)
MAIRGFDCVRALRVEPVKKKKKTKMPADSPCPTLNDEALLQALKAGLSAGYELLVDRYLRLVLLTIWRVFSDVRGAEALAQDILREIAQAAGEYDENNGPLKNWISEQAYRRTITHFNSLMLRNPHTCSRELGEAPERELCPEERPALELLSGSLNLSTHAQPQVLRMVLLEGLSFGQVARLTNQKIERIRRDYYRALEKLRDGALAHIADREARPVITVGRIRRADA